MIETFYAVSQLLEDPVQGDDTLVALGAKFSSLPLEEMQKVVEQTKFYKTAEAPCSFTKARNSSRRQCRKSSIFA